VTTDRTRPASSERKVRFGLLPKIILFLFAALVPLAAITWYVSVQTLRQKMTEEFTSKGMAIAKSLASSSVDLLLTRDASTVQSAIDQFAAISGVQYVVVYDAGRHLVAHTFAPLVPAGLVEKNVVPGDAVQQVKDVQYTDPVTGTESHIIDIGVPVLAGQLGTVRVGMDRAIIEAAAAGAGERLLFIFAGAAVVAVLAGVVFARRISKPIGEVVRIAERVGQGDLSKLVPVTSRDEIGQLAHTFNDTVVRLRSLVQTEAERDDERRTRENLQRNITRFLHRHRDRAGRPEQTWRRDVRHPGQRRRRDQRHGGRARRAHQGRAPVGPPGLGQRQRPDRDHGPDDGGRPGPVARGDGRVERDGGAHALGASGRRERRGVGQRRSPHARFRAEGR